MLKWLLSLNVDHIVNLDGIIRKIGGKYIFSVLCPFTYLMVKLLKVKTIRCQRC